MTTPRRARRSQGRVAVVCSGAAVRTLPALVGVAVCLAVVIVAVTGPRSSHGPSGGVGSSLRSLPAWDASDGHGPSLSALVAHFVVLRRPATAADRAARARFAVGVGSGGQTEYPVFVRLAGDANGIPVYFAVYAQHRHGASGPVVGYSMTIAEQGLNYTASNYLIFPSVVSAGADRRRSEYLSVVPDGVRAVRWHLACPGNARGCVLPGAQHTVSVPVRDNLAVLPVRTANPGTYYAGAVGVTWDRDDGTRTTFTNANAAVPFAGAPAWPDSRRPPSQSYAPGNGPQNGESLSHWRSQYGVLRRPQDALDRSATAKAVAGAARPIIPDLTRVVLDTGHTMVFMTLSAVNPGARPPDRRYVAEVWSAGKGSGETTQSQTFTPGVQIPFGLIEGAGSQLEYSIVPDDVTKVSWPIKCSSGCGQLSRSPLVLPARHNVVSATVTAGSWSIDHATWYLRGGAKPLQAGP